MKKLHKNMLAFTVVYWTLVAIGLVLTGFSMQKVPIGYYGLKVHYFSSNVDSQYYTNGLYNSGLGYYFVLYPQSRSYLLDRQITVINKDLEKVTVTYTLSYRVNPSGILSMYYSVADQYEAHLLAIVNNIVSSVFSTLTQAESRVTAQSKIVDEYNTNGKGRVDAIFTKGIVVEAIWVDKLQFATSQPYYDSAYLDSSSSSPSYQAASFNLTIAKLELNAANSSLQTSKEAFIKRMQLEGQRSYDSLTTGSITAYESNMLNLSLAYNVSRVFNYYRPSGIVFQ